MPTQATVVRPASRLRATARSMRVGLVALFCIGIAPFVALSAWYLHAEREAAIGRALLDADRVAAATAANVHWMLEDAETVLASIASRPGVRDVTNERCDPIFSGMRDVYPAYENIVQRALDGSLVCAPRAMMSNHAVSEAPWFRAAIAADGFRAGPTFYAPALQKWVAIVTHPVRRDDRTTGSLMIMPLDIDVLRKRLFSHLPANALASLIDGNGNVLARSADHDARVGRGVRAEVAGAVAAMRERRLHDDAGGAASIHVSRTSADGVARLETMRAVPGTDWVVIAGFPEADALAGYYAERNAHIVAILLAFAAAAAFALALQRRILRPVHALARTAAAVAAGREDRRADERGVTELAEVAAQFNRMLEVQGRARQALEASNARLTALMEALPAGVIVYDAGGRVESCNASAALALGLDRTAVIGSLADRRTRLLFDADGVRRSTDRFPIHRVLATGEPFHEVVGYLPANDPRSDRTSERVDPTQLAYMQVSALPERDRDGRIVRVVLAFVDVTAQRAADTLRAAKESAESANRAKSTFLSRMSHDLRTPLVAVMGYTQLFQMDARLPADVKQRAGLVLAGCRQLLALLDESLDLARIEAGVVRLEIAPLAMEPLVGECLALLDALATPRGIALGVDDGAPIDGGTVLADRDNVRRVLMNLVSNAIKYNRPGGAVRIGIHRSRDAAGQAVVAVEVRDTGIGLTERQLAHLFEPFNRLGADTSGTEGHGLGLVIARALAQAMGGDLVATSTVGVGSCFTLLLPAVVTDAVVTEEPVTSSTRRETETASA